MGKIVKKHASSISKENLGLTGEYAVASELTRRGIYAQLTLGTRKRTDLLLDVEDGKMLRVQVKAKQAREWPACKGVCGSTIVLVLVDYQGKGLNDRPDFYILTEADWRKFIQVIQARNQGHTWDVNLVPTGSDGFVGIGVRSSDVIAYKERWDKIEKLLGLPGHLPQKNEK